MDQAGWYRHISHHGGLRLLPKKGTRSPMRGSATTAGLVMLSHLAEDSPSGDGKLQGYTQHTSSGAAALLTTPNGEEGPWGAPKCGMRVPLTCLQSIRERLRERGERA